MRYLWTKEYLLLNQNYGNNQGYQKKIINRRVISDANWQWALDFSCVPPFYRTVAGKTVSVASVMASQHFVLTILKYLSIDNEKLYNIKV